MKLIVGLGNPGIEYQFTLHNYGFLAIDRLAERHAAHISNRRCRALTGKAVMAGHEVLLAKPETYMNLSGLSVRELVDEYEVNPTRDLIVIYDDLDLPFGTLRVRTKGGAGGHHGMESIIGALKTQDFLRIRLGISPEREVGDGAKYVLSPFKKSQYAVVDEVLDSAATAVEAILAEGPNAAMNKFNRRPEAQEQSSEKQQ
ncbi:MAG TPA: aminoacyl-tRNA hydrolase [Terriglobales bacterium]|nr:aminoacyl-tRNA hydrolase [Terriglobales bacterium]